MLYPHTRVYEVIECCVYYASSHLWEQTSESLLELEIWATTEHSLVKLVLFGLYKLLVETRQTPRQARTQLKTDAMRADDSIT
jgi:hypothetical protein